MQQVEELLPSCGWRPVRRRAPSRRKRGGVALVVADTVVVAEVGGRTSGLADPGAVDGLPSGIVRAQP